MNEPYNKQIAALLAEERYEDVQEVLSKADIYTDASERSLEVYYIQAEALLAQGNEDALPSRRSRRQKGMLMLRSEFLPFTVHRHSDTWIRANTSFLWLLLQRREMTKSRTNGMHRFMYKMPRRCLHRVNMTPQAKRLRVREL